MKRLQLFCVPYLRGVGQIMLQNNALTGLLFLLGIFYNSVVMGIAALLAVITGTLTAKIAGYNQEEINDGLYGFSAALVGVALTFYFKPLPVIWVAVVVGSVLAAMIQHFFIVKKMPGFTFPFIVVTWLCLYLFHQVIVVSGPDAVAAGTPVNDAFNLVAHGFGEVIFQGSVVTGILFFIAVFINSPVAALYGVAGAVLSAFIALQLGAAPENISIGLFSFNAVLCAITFQGNKSLDGIFVFLAVVLSVLINVAMVKLNYTVLTFPFVAASWITLGVKQMMKVRVS
ncbi:urea transporter [Chitinophaga sp. MM2321]|uniref:urea transporter n=1 Tax=Chitinophaga sp. MM2321 TaxID=3137178 RepID=UPI0032D5AB34